MHQHRIMQKNIWKSAKESQSPKYCLVTYFPTKMISVSNVNANISFLCFLCLFPQVQVMQMKAACRYKSFVFLICTFVFTTKVNSCNLKTWATKILLLWYWSLVFFNLCSPDRSIIQTITFLTYTYAPASAPTCVGHMWSMESWSR